MVRKKDIRKVNKIINVLVKYPEGIWIRKLSNESKLAVSTIYFYLDNILNDIIENIGVKDKKDRYLGLRIVKLKLKVRENIEKNGLKYILNFLKMCGKI